MEHISYRRVDEVNAQQLSAGLIWQLMCFPIHIVSLKVEFWEKHLWRHNYAALVSPWQSDSITHYTNVRELKQTQRYWRNITTLALAREPCLGLYYRYRLHGSGHIKILIFIVIIYLFMHYNFMFLYSNLTRDWFILVLIDKIYRSKTRRLHRSAIT